MRKKPWIPIADWLGIGLLLIGLLARPPAALLAQTPTAPADEAGTMEEKKSPAEEPADAVGEDKPPQDRGGAYRRQKDNLKPFEPSEEIRVDKAVDFPADI